MDLFFHLRGLDRSARLFSKQRIYDSFVDSQAEGIVSVTSPTGSTIQTSFHTFPRPPKTSADFSGQHVLEIGCGDGRVTWLYADKAAHVTAIEPAARLIALARQDLPAQLKDRVEFRESNFEDFAAGSEPFAFDIVILSWSLC